jgi:hypothetical protein
LNRVQTEALLDRGQRYLTLGPIFVLALLLDNLLVLIQQLHR